MRASRYLAVETISADTGYVINQPQAPSPFHSRAIMRWCLVVLYVAAGIGHVYAPGGFVSITPSWVPFPEQVIFLTGLCELAGSVALLIPRLRWYAGIAFALYALSVWPANFKHAFDHIVIPPIPDSWWYHGPRLALQPVLIWWALYATNVIDWPWRKTDGKG